MALALHGIALHDMICHGLSNNFGTNPITQECSDRTDKLVAELNLLMVSGPTGLRLDSKNSQLEN